jgi:hypothetical protein
MAVEAYFVLRLHRFGEYPTLLRLKAESSDSALVEAETMIAILDCDRPFTRKDTLNVTLMMLFPEQNIAVAHIIETFGTGEPYA